MYQKLNIGRFANSLDFENHLMDNSVDFINSRNRLDPEFKDRFKKNKLKNSIMTLDLKKFPIKLGTKFI